MHVHLESRFAEELEEDPEGAGGKGCGEAHVVPWDIGLESSVNKHIFVHILVFVYAFAHISYRNNKDSFG